jgi:tetratricopeptide (TPR) repeat protein
MNDPTKLAINGPADLIAAVPYLIGFAPEHSLAAVGLKSRGLECTFRVDLPGSTDHLDLLNTLTEPVQVNGCTAVVLIAYGEADLATACLNQALTDYARIDIEVLDALRVTDGRYFNPTCTDPCCPPPEGLPVPQDSAVAAALVAAGANRHPDRDAITALLAPAAPDRRAAVAAAVDDAQVQETALSWGEQRQMDVAAVDQWIGAADLPESPEDIAFLGLAVGDLDVRDRALIASDTDPAKAAELWLWVARHLNEDLAAPAFTIAGWCAYRYGNGVLALEAFEQALNCSPTYRLAHLLLAALQAGIPPKALGAMTCLNSEPASA